MTEARQRGLEILTGYPADVVAVAAVGHVERSDYEELLIPAVTERIRAEGKVKLLYLIGPHFKGFTTGAAWDDAKLGFLHMGDFARVAVVTDIEWIRLGVRLTAPLMACPVRVFHLAETATARDWICGDEPPDRGGGPAVDVEQKLPLTEDFMAPKP